MSSRIASSSVRFEGLSSSCLVAMCTLFPLIHTFYFQCDNSEQNATHNDHIKSIHITNGQIIECRTSVSTFGVIFGLWPPFLLCFLDPARAEQL